MLPPLIEEYFNLNDIESVLPIAQAGSARRYHRVICKDGRSYILCENESVEENETFAYLTQIFTQLQLAVPTLLHMQSDRKAYIVSDLGDTSLLDQVLHQKENSGIRDLYEAALTSLIRFQIDGGKLIDFAQCFGAQAFDRQAVLNDLHYFKYYFLDLHALAYDKHKLSAEFDQLADTLGQNPEPYFMYRDYQGRNIMINDGKLGFIDYQGGMRGPLQYDVASLLWQAKAALPFELKTTLYDFYKQQLQKRINIHEAEFDTTYYRILLLRLLQVMGAYGLRGLIQHKPHFVESIPFGLQNIAAWMQHFQESIAAYPELSTILTQLTSTEFISQYHSSTSATAKKLTVTIQSFSYKKGIPEDQSGNGGGYMFDCRGLLNPGRFAEYKYLTGRDQPVIDFLESKTKIATFLQHAYALVDISMHDYLARGFENLQISFGCTGGQHRSVYCADAMAKYLQKKYPVHIVLRHLIQDEKKWINQAL